MPSVSELARMMAEAKPVEQIKEEVKAEIGQKIDMIEKVKEATKEMLPSFVRERDSGGNHRLTVMIPGISPKVSNWEGPDRLAKITIGAMTYCSAGDNILNQFPKVFTLREIPTAQIKESKL